MFCCLVVQVTNTAGRKGGSANTLSNDGAFSSTEKDPVMKVFP
jgi:hypothetical protein